jgi:hypothetical protein
MEVSGQVYAPAALIPGWESIWAQKLKNGLYTTEVESQESIYIWFVENSSKWFIKGKGRYYLEELGGGGVILKPALKNQTGFI